jgi:hypothetical protein
MIDGLKLTISGAELRSLLAARIDFHNQQAARWARERERTPCDETEDAPLLPEHMCENEEERHLWRARVVAFIRDHVDAAETYRLSSADLEFGELLPEPPGSLAQEEFEEGSRVGFALDRLARAVERLEPFFPALGGGPVGAS